jgi:hypothetical protein
MLASEVVLKWAMRFYPPLFFQRILVRRFDKQFRGVEVNIRKSFLNTNHNGAIFGGTIYAAADPFHPMLFYHILTLKGYKVLAWSRSSAIRYFKPAKTDLHFKITISDIEIALCEKQLKLTGKYRKSFQLEIYNTEGKLCSTVINEMYIRDLNHPETQNGAEA